METADATCQTIVQPVYSHRTPSWTADAQEVCLTRSSLMGIQQCRLHDAEWFKGPGFCTHGGQRPREAFLQGPQLIWE